MHFINAAVDEYVYLVALTTKAGMLDIFERMEKEVAELTMTKVGCHYNQACRMEEGYYDSSSLVFRLYREVRIEIPNEAST